MTTAALRTGLPFSSLSTTKLRVASGSSCFFLARDGSMQSKTSPTMLTVRTEVSIPRSLQEIVIRGSRQCHDPSGAIKKYGGESLVPRSDENAAARPQAPQL